MVKLLNFSKANIAFLGGNIIMNSRRTKGEGTIRKRADGRWEGRFIDSTRQTRYIYRYSRSEVSEELRKLVSLKSMNIFDSVGGDVDFDTWFEHYCAIKSLSIKQRSIHQIKCAYNKHIKPILGKKLIYRIKPNDILKVVKSVRNKGLSDCSVNNIITHFKGMIRFAVQENIIQKNPLIPIKTSRKPKKKRRSLTPSEINCILEEARAQERQIYLMIYTLISTGIRVSELCGLKWNYFAADYSYIAINAGHTDNIFETSLKSEASERVVYLSDDLREKFIEFYHICKQNRRSLKYIFINRKKRPFTDATVEKRLHYITNKRFEKNDISRREDDTKQRCLQN